MLFAEKYILSISKVFRPSVPRVPEMLAAPAEINGKLCGALRLEQSIADFAIFARM